MVGSSAPSPRHAPAVRSGAAWGGARESHGERPHTLGGHAIQRCFPAAVCCSCALQCCRGLCRDSTAFSGRRRSPTSAGSVTSLLSRTTDTQAYSTKCLPRMATKKAAQYTRYCIMRLYFLHSSSSRVRGPGLLVHPWLLRVTSVLCSRALLCAGKSTATAAVHTT